MFEFFPTSDPDMTLIHFDVAPVVFSYRVGFRQSPAISNRIIASIVSKIITIFKFYYVISFQTEVKQRVSDNADRRAEEKLEGKAT
jgi:hypothetical protein